MEFDFDNLERPIFIQLAELFEDNILKGIFLPDEQIPSIAEISGFYKINPATANKSIARLSDEGLVYKKRGVGMFVAGGAKAAIQKKRIRGFQTKFVTPMLEEARKLGIQDGELTQMIQGFLNKAGGEQE